MDLGGMEEQGREGAKDDVEWYWNDFEHTLHESLDTRKHRSRNWSSARIRRSSAPRLVHRSTSSRLCIEKCFQEATGFQACHYRTTEEKSYF